MAIAPTYSSRRHAVGLCKQPATLRAVRQFSGKRALITGAGAGIGRAIASALIERGCIAVLADIDAPAVQAAASELGGTAHVLDVTDPHQWAAAAEQIGALDILVNNAGVHTYGSFATQSPEDFDFQMSVNFNSVVYGCRAFLPRLSPGGQIVNIASLAGTVGVPNQSAYCASKFAVRGFTAALRAEQSAANIGVTAVIPGAVRTSILRKSRSSDPEQTDRFAEMMERHGVRAETVAKRVVRAIKRNTAEAFVGPDCHAAQWLIRFAPWLMRWGLVKMNDRYAA